ncbi:MAG: aldehyde ferredoxin oxidoreductase C-terminal domain-containing protein, partial [Chloroflexota bacterium]
MRKYLDINLNDQGIAEKELTGEEIVRAGRYLIAKTLYEAGVATLDPMSPDNPLIFSAGPLAGTTFSNANRTSVGCKSPLTGGIKESNGGGTFSYALGQQHIAGFTLHGVSDDWVVIHFHKDGTITFDDAEPYMGKGNFEAAEMLHEKYGKKVSLGICGPVGEYEGLLAGIAFSDVDLRPSRMAARGGVGAVMGNKKVKAIVVDLAKMPQLHERKKVLADGKEYSRKLQADAAIEVYGSTGTMAMADYTNHVGGLPTLNFSTGQATDTDLEAFKMGGDYIRDLNNSRGGNHTHACMPGCVIQCSNVYADADGNEMVSPVEYETISLLGTNCGLSDPDDLARLNYVANDLGVDTIETGAMLAVLMEAGVGEFGDAEFMHNALEEVKQGTENGRLWAQGTARVGEHYNVARVPVIKKQAISAYDPRVIEVTGLSMMISAQGADHTTGNVPKFESKSKDLDQLMEASMGAQITSAATDSLGLCIFGRSVTNANTDFLAQAVNNAIGTNLEQPFFLELGRETLKIEAAFNKDAGFTAEDDDLPE